MMPNQITGANAGGLRQGLPEKDQTLSVEYRRILRDYISYVLATRKHTARGKKMLYLGSTWDDKEKVRSGKATIIEASSLEESADLCDLIYLRHKPITMLVEWCVPIFDTFYKSMINERSTATRRRTARGSTRRYPQGEG